MKEDILEILYQGNSLNKKQCIQLFNSIAHKQLSEIQIATALISMKIRGETITEIIEATNTMLSYSKPFPSPNTLFADIAGTGGDKKNTINISTASAIIASTCKAKIIKHGNYSISSLTGSTDLLKEHNIHLNHYEHQVLKNFHELGICFLNACQYNKILKNIMPIRKQLNTPTIFNIIGPLINPARPTLTLIGVYKKELLSSLIQVLKLLNYNHAIVVHCDGIDEVGLHNSTHVSELYNNTINKYTLTPSDFGLHSYPIKELYCDSKQMSYDYMIQLLQGKGKPAHTAVVAANVALLLTLFGYKDLRSNVSMVLEKIHAGIPYKKLMLLSKLY